MKQHTLLQHGQTKVINSAGNETIVTPKGQETCAICCKNFTSKVSLQNHMRIVHTEDAIFVCELCGQKFKYKRTFKYHLLSHDVGEEESYQCPLCKYNFKQQRWVIPHIKKVHSDIIQSNETLQKFMLNIKNFRNPCDKREFFNILNKISATCKVSMRFRCNICSLTHVSRASLVSHKLRIHSQRKYTKYHCNDCIETFPNRSRLTTHIKRHLKPYECKTCGKRLESLCSLETHEMKHDMNYQCICDFCQRAFTSRGLLYQHIKRIELRLITSSKAKRKKNGASASTRKTKLPKQQFSCDICLELFNNKKSLTHHQGMKHGQMLSCKICGLCYLEASKLEKHQAAHATADKYQCDSCHSKYYSESALEKHQQLVCYKQPSTASSWGDKLGDMDIVEISDNLRILADSTAEMLDDSSNESNIEELPQPESDACSQYSSRAPSPNLEAKEPDVLVEDMANGSSSQLCSLGSSSAEPVVLTPVGRSLTRDTPIIESACLPFALSKGISDPLKLENLSDAKGGATVSINTTKTKPPNQQLSCDKCSELFDDKKSLSNHQEIKHGQTFPCGLYISEVGTLDMHQAAHSNTEEYQCDSCHSIFYSESALEQHQQLPCSGQPSSLQDKSYSETFDTQDTLNQRFNLDHEKEKLTCKICQRIFSTVKSLRRHLYLHNEEPRYECKECHKKFRSHTGMKQHTLLQHGQTKVVDGNKIYVTVPKQQETCAICCKTFASKHSLQRHIETLHTENAKFVCESCGQKFKYKSTFTHHLLSHNIGEEESYECPLCKLNFKLQRLVIPHIKKEHSNVIQSNETLQKFMLKVKDFRNHNDKREFFNILKEMSATYKVPSFRCNICSSTHATSIDLSSHKSKFHPQRKYTEYHCHDCGEMLATRSRLLTHIKEHFKQNEHKTCETRLESPNSLKTHEPKHEKIYRFNCGFCQCKFTSRTLLYQHMKFTELHLPTSTKKQKNGANASSSKKKRKLSKQQFSCDKCSEIFSNKKSLAHHQEIKHGQMFSCTKCGLCFSEARKLEEHRSTHPLTYQCSSCLSQYYSISALFEHQHSDWDCNRQYIPMPEGRVQCKLCLEIFDTRFKLNKHFKLLHPKERLTCKICQRVFATPRTLSKHLFVHSEVPRFDCKECHKKFKSSTGLKMHTLQQHGRTKVVDSAGNETYVAVPKQQETCNICSKKFAAKNSLRTHMRVVHTEDAKFCCENCGQKFKYKKTFKHHMLSHNVGVEVSYECPLCKNKFKLQNGVLSHIRKIHSDVLKSNETLKELTLKGKDLRNPSNKQKFFDILIEIAATYQAPTSFRCDICSSIHATRKSLVSHKYRIHSQGGYAEYHCDYCGKTFPNRSTLTTDIEQHIKPYECKTCGARLGSLSTLKTHETKHEQFYRFTCDFCQRKFSSRALLYQHMKFIELRLTRI